jgi:hypothetical protein
LPDLNQEKYDEYPPAGVPQVPVSMGKLMASSFAMTPLGKLFLALTQEEVWSKDYTVGPDFGLDGEHLWIKHPLFPPNQELRIYEKDVTENTSTRDVAELVRRHLHEMQKSFEPPIQALREKQYVLGREARNILVRQMEVAMLAIASGTDLLVETAPTPDQPLN